MAFGKLGSIIFKTLYAPKSLETKGATAFAEHKVIEGSPILQYVGEDLQDIALELTLNRGFCDPEASREELKSAREQGEPLALTIGQTSYGDFVIVSIEERHAHCTPTGRPYHLDLRLALKEHVSVSESSGSGEAVTPGGTISALLSGASEAVSSGLDELSDAELDDLCDLFDLDVEDADGISGALSAVSECGTLTQSGLAGGLSSLSGAGSLGSGLSSLTSVSSALQSVAEVTDSSSSAASKLSKLCGGNYSATSLSSVLSGTGYAGTNSYASRVASACKSTGQAVSSLKNLLRS